MGFSTLLDILGSTVVGGLLLLILFRMNSASVENTFTNGGELLVQQDLTEVVKLLEYDFRKIGYCKNYNKIPDATKAILLADSTSITFLTDVANPPSYPNGDGNVDTMKYYLGTTAQLSTTSNPDDRLLYRVINSETPAGSNLGITTFYLTYYNALGSILPAPVTHPGEIATIQIDIEVQNQEAYDNKYSSVFWRQIRMVAPNLRNR